jgi:hypothetical protein
MDPFIESEIVAREARIDPALDAARAGYRLIAIGQALALAHGDRQTDLSAFDLLLEGAAICLVGAATELFATAGCASDASPRPGHRFGGRATDSNPAAPEGQVAARSAAAQQRRGP